MIRKILLIIVILFTSISYAQNSYSDHYYKRFEVFKNEPDTKNEIIFLGNSITEGGNWVELFPDVNAVNRGISGDVTDGILNRLDEVLSSKPTKIFLLIGTNDLARGRSIDYVLKYHQLIIDKIKSDSKHTKVYLQSVLPFNPNVGNGFSGHKSKQQVVVDLNKKLRKLARKNKIKYIKLHKAFKNSKGELIADYTYDGLHLSKNGYLHWQQFIEKKVYKN